MSSQWETARQCQMALALLSAKIKQANDSSTQQGTPNPHAYAMSTPDRESASSEAANVLGNDINHVNGPSAGVMYQTGTMYQQDISGARSDRAPVSRWDNSNPEGTSAEELDFRDSETSHLAGGSNFDLSMVELLQGANFDSLFDLIGQQYPSF